MPKAPKYGHLRDLHNLIKSYSKAFLEGKQSFELLAHGYEVGNNCFHHFCTKKLEMFCVTVFCYWTVNFLLVWLVSCTCRHTTSRFLRKSYAWLSSPTTIQGRMELWIFEGTSTTFRVAPFPSLQTASMWCTTQREYVHRMQLRLISKDISSVVIKSIHSWLVLCICYARCLFNTVKGHTIQPTRRPRTMFGRCSQSWFRGINKLISGTRNPWSSITWPRTIVTICGTPQGVVSFITPSF